ncbi:MAG: hypothetical protein D6768_09205, partial [Chloroflexi bacterium]
MTFHKYLQVEQIWRGQEILPALSDYGMLFDQTEVFAQLAEVDNLISDEGFKLRPGHKELVQTALVAR